MELSKRQLEILDILAQSPGSRLYFFQTGGGNTRIEYAGRTEDLSDKTASAIILAGFVKNVGSNRYRAYTISPSGLRALIGSKNKDSKPSSASKTDPPTSKQMNYINYLITAKAYKEDGEMNARYKMIRDIRDRNVTKSSASDFISMAVKLPDMEHIEAIKRIEGQLS